MSSGSPGPPDVVEAGGRPWSVWVRIGVSAAAVLIMGVGLLTYQSHQYDDGRAAVRSTPQPSVSPSISSSPVAVVVPFSTGNRECGQQERHHIQVGFQLVNDINAVVDILDVHLRIPGISLPQVAVSSNECGAVAGRGGLPFVIRAGGTQWVTVTVVVSGPCPASNSIQVDVVYSAPQQSGRFRLSPFPDFGGPLLDCVQPPSRKRSDQSRPA